MLEYVPSGETGPDHDKCFSFKVLLNKKVIGEGTGKTKKEAQQQAAKNALSSVLK